MNKGMSLTTTKSLAPLETEVIDQMDTQRNLSSIKRTAAARTGTIDEINVKVEKSQSTPALFKLNIDCFAKIFDFLSLVELMNVAQTCKLMHRVAGFIFQLHYPFANVIVNENGMHLENHETLLHFTAIFGEYIQCIVFSDVMNDDDTVHIQWDQFKSIRRVNFYYTVFNTERVDVAKNILQNVDTLELSDCYFGCELFEYFLDLCKNIKHLIITINYDYNYANWLHKHYPHLETLTIVPIVYIRRQISELMMFFKKNPRVRKFFTSSKFLSDNKAFILQAKFDDLKVQIEDYEFGAVCILLNELYAKGVYKRFFISFFECFKIQQPLIDQLKSINALVGLSVPYNVIDLNLSLLVNLEVLRFECNINQIIDVAQLAHSLTNLKEISFSRASTDDILPFIYQSPKLRKVAIEKLDIFHGSINLLVMNEMRRQLFGTTVHVSKVLIYIPENAYLRIRRKSITMNLDLVEILRYELFDNNRF